MKQDKLIRLEDAIESVNNNIWYTESEKASVRCLLRKVPAVEALPVTPGHHVGDVCIYGFGSPSGVMALVEIQKILDDERGIAEIKFLKMFVDTGNNFFDYLLRTGQTMNGSFKYLKNITPRRGE